MIVPAANSIQFKDATKGWKNSDWPVKPAKKTPWPGLNIETIFQVASSPTPPKQNKVDPLTVAKSANFSLPTKFPTMQPKWSPPEHELLRRSLGQDINL